MTKTWKLEVLGSAATIGNIVTICMSGMRKLWQLPRRVTTIWVTASTEPSAQAWKIRFRRASGDSTVAARWTAGNSSPKRLMYIRASEKLERAGFVETGEISPVWISLEYEVGDASGD